MALPVIIIRPEPGAESTMQRFRAAGLFAQKHSMFAIRAIKYRLFNADRYDALIIASANAIRFATPVEAWQNLPVYAVGSQTSRIAHDVGLNVVFTGTGGITSLLSQCAIDGHRKILRLAGRDHIKIDDKTLLDHSATNMQIDTVIVYESVPSTIPSALVKILKREAIVLLHSARSAQYFASECDRNSISRSKIQLATFGEAITKAAGSGWKRVETAAQPNDEALLALTLQLCKE